jgi:DNA polymerase
VSEAHDLLRRYVRQRIELSEPPLVLETPVMAEGVPPDRRDAGAPTPHPQAQRPNAELDRPGRPAGSTGEGPRWKRDAPTIPERGIVVAPPANDFFSDDPIAQLPLDALAERVGSCTRCVLSRSRTNAVPGEGPTDARLVVVGEGPGATEDETGRPFVGRAGALLTDILSAIDLPREQVFICNVVKCRPPQNRKPAPAEIEACLPYLHRQLDILRPAVILAMGGTAAETLLETKQSLGALRNKVHEFRGIPVVVTYHPAALLRNPHWKKPTWDDVRIARQLVDRHP